jgi:K+-transporting ATPase A subunit
MENVSIFYGHLVNFTAIRYVLVYFMLIWYIFPRFGMLYQEKSGNPALQSVSREESHRAEESAHRA